MSHGEDVRVKEPIRLDRAFVQDPHALYRRLRAEAPAHQVEMWGGVRAWLVTRYSEARVLLNDPRLGKDQNVRWRCFRPVQMGPTLRRSM